MDRAVFEHCFDTDWYGYELLTNSNYRYLEDCHFKLYFACLCPCWNPPYYPMVFKSKGEVFVGCHIIIVAWCIRCFCCQWKGCKLAPYNILLFIYTMRINIYYYAEDTIFLPCNSALFTSVRHYLCVHV